VLLAFSLGWLLAILLGEQEADFDPAGPICRCSHPAHVHRVKGGDHNCVAGIRDENGKINACACQHYVPAKPSLKLKSSPDEELQKLRRMAGL
jgi:hypothetical protein